MPLHTRFYTIEPPGLGAAQDKEALAEESGSVPAETTEE